jgi:hypothetical protein
LADSIYWTNSQPDNRMQGAPLAGGGTVDTLYGSAQGLNIALAVAIDPAAGRIYWTNYGDNTIRGAPLAGGGTIDTLYGPAQGVSYPMGVAIDPAAGRIYWTNGEWDQGAGGTIRRAPLAGGGTVDTLYGPAQGVSGPTGLAIDKDAGRIYWGNSNGATIQGAPLAGGGTVDTLYGGSAQGVSGPWGVAIDAGRIYWANYGDKTIRGAPLAGGGSVDTLYSFAQGVRDPTFVAIDHTPAEPTGHFEPRGAEPLAVDSWYRRLAEWVGALFAGPSGSPGRIYWSNGGDNTIRRAPLAGGGTVDTLYGSAQGVSSPSALALLRPPVGTGAPTASWSLMLPDGPFGGLQFGGTHSGALSQRVSCSRGTWAADLPGCSLYRAPQSFAFQWRLGGTDIGGATAANYTPNAPGSYTCRVTATNRAGSATQMSTAVTVS